MSQAMSSSAAVIPLVFTKALPFGYAYTDAEARSVTRAGIKVLTLGKKHVERMQEIMSKHGGNLKLIRLYTSEGTGDIAMLAYILAERDTPDTLFPETYTLVTQDAELRAVAESYGIPCVPSL